VASAAVFPFATRVPALLVKLIVTGRPLVTAAVMIAVLPGVTALFAVSQLT
jgi:hypothetical protein